MKIQRNHINIMSLDVSCVSNACVEGIPQQWLDVSYEDCVLSCEFPDLSELRESR